MIDHIKNNSTFKGNWQEIALVSGILILGILLRFYNYASITMSHDELSAWNRLQVNGFDELITKGIYVDGHPAGVQIWLYYWSKLFGDSALSLKIPFWVCSILALFSGYRLAKRWFGSVCGLIVLAYLSTLQYPIFYSHFARPYASGFLFCILLVDFWSHWIEDNKKSAWWGYVFMSILCLYNHYFSFIMAGLVGFIGLWIVPKVQIKHYLLALFLIAFAYIPHLGILYTHLFETKGIAFYGKPDLNYLLKFFSYLLHHSPFLIVLFFILFLGGFGLKIPLSRQQKQWQIIALLLFFIPLGFGYFYSVYRSPILRHSHLLFGFPFLIIALFARYANTLNWSKTTLLIVLIISSNTYSLIADRQHFKIVYKHPHNQFITTTKTFLNQAASSAKQTTIIYKENPKYLAYYEAIHENSPDYYNFFNYPLSDTAFAAYLEQQTSNFLILGSLYPIHLNIALDYYPHIHKTNFGYYYDYYILSKKSAALDSLITYNQTNDFTPISNRSPFKEWKDCKTDSSDNNPIAWVEQEWGPSLEIPIDSLASNRLNIFDIRIDTRKMDSSTLHASLCFVVKKGYKTIYWESKPLQTGREWITTYFSRRLKYIFKKPSLMKDTTLSVFVWNHNKQPFAVDNFQVQVRKDNPILYADFDYME